MKTIVLVVFAFFIIACALFVSCKKEEVTPIPVISYSVWGKLDTLKTTLPSARLVKAMFTLSYSNISGNESDAVFNGGFNLLNYSGINNRDTLVFYATNINAVDTIFSIANDSIRSTKITNNYIFYNGDSARFSSNNYPLKNNFSATVKLGKGYFRLGRFPKYVFVKLDSVVKQP